MKIRRIIAPDMRQAIRQVREALGADAVILSNKRTEEGVEIIAALDVEAMLASDVKKPASPVSSRSESSTDTKPDPVWPPRPEARERRPDPWAEDSFTFSAAARKVASASPKVATAPLKPLHEPSIAAAQADEDLPDPYARDRDPRLARGDEAATRVTETPSPSVQRLEDEVRDLRSLMESQLRVLEWNRYARHHPLQSELMRRLSSMGLAPRLAREIVESIGDAALGARGWDLALQALVARLPVLDEDITEKGGMYALVGATGVGKTTTVAKLAARFVMRHGRKDIALVTTDNFRIGAYDQLRVYARILDVPLYVAENAQALAQTLETLSDRRLVLVDTAGMSQRDTRLMGQMQSLRSASAQLKSLLVLSASAQRAMTLEAVRKFSGLSLTGCVLTKLDEAAQLGDALTAIADSGLPVAWLGMGQRVPEDLAPARAERLVAKAVALMQRDSDDDMIDERMGWSWMGEAAHG